MKVNKLLLYGFLLAAFLTGGLNMSHAQNGDQILDGIGETGLIARYVFNGDSKDWSRNNLHAKFTGQDTAFVNDNRFGKVLSLTGDKNTFVMIPAEALTDLESLSISGWIYLKSKQPGQRFFDFGIDENKHFFAAPVGTHNREGYQVELTAEKGNQINIPVRGWCPEEDHHR